MKTRSITAIAAGAAVGVASFLAMQARSQDAPPDAPPPSQLSPKEMFRMAAEQSKPTEHHKRLEPLVGTFDYEARWLVPGMDPIVVAGVSENEWILGGRFLRATARSADPELPVESVATYGYDTRPGRNDYFTIGIDTVGTYYVAPRGQWDEEKNAFIFTGEESEGGRSFKYRQSITVKSDDEHVFRHGMLMPDGSMMEMAEITYTRRK